MKDKDSQSSLSDDVRTYYEQGLEISRLSSPEGQLEFARTQEIIARFLPEPPAIILDIGGGPGAYATWLSKLRYEVHLVDPMPLHVDQSREASNRQPEFPIRSITIGDARHVDKPDDFADLVLLLGPLYHLTEQTERIAAMREAYRLLKPGALLIGVAISKYASTLAGLIDGYITDPQFLKIMKQDLLDGQHRNPTHKAKYFTEAYFHHPDELVEEVLEAGFSIECMLAVEGPAVFLQDLEDRWINIEQRNLIIESIRWVEEEPALLGATGHLAVVGRKEASYQRSINKRMQG
ncbi:MAG: class I SAM-dependent methyltransferase [Anaerolineales bacterium]